MDKGKLRYGSWMKAPTRGGGVKSRSNPPSQNKSTGNSDTSPSLSSTKEKNELLGNRNLMPLALQQHMESKVLGEISMTEGDKNLSLGHDSIIRSDQSSKLLNQEDDENKVNQQNTNDNAPQDTMDEKEEHLRESVEQSIKSAGKKWKRLAHDKGVQEVNKRNQKSIIQNPEEVQTTESVETSHTKKRSLDINSFQINDTETAVVVKQPRRAL